MCRPPRTTKAADAYGRGKFKDAAAEYTEARGRARAARAPAPLPGETPPRLCARGERQAIARSRATT